MLKFCFLRYTDWVLMFKRANNLLLAPFLIIPLLKRVSLNQYIQKSIRDFWVFLHLKRIFLIVVYKRDRGLQKSTAKHDFSFSSGNMWPLNDVATIRWTDNNLTFSPFKRKEIYWGCIAYHKEIFYISLRLWT